MLIIFVLNWPIISAVTWAFWWIGDYDETLSSLKYPSDQVDLNDPFGKDTDKCLSVRHEVSNNGPWRAKTCLQGFLQSETQTNLFSYTD